MSGTLVVNVGLATGGVYKKAVYRNFAIFTGKLLCWSLFLIKLKAFRLATLLKRNSNTGVFPVKIAKFLRTTIFKIICERLLL